MTSFYSISKIKEFKYTQFVMSIKISAFA